MKRKYALDEEQSEESQEKPATKKVRRHSQPKLIQPKSKEEKYLPAWMAQNIVIGTLSFC